MMPISANEEVSLKQKINTLIQKVPISDTQGICHMVLKTIECIEKRPT
jgi:hypothetical protein